MKIKLLSLLIILALTAAGAYFFLLKNDNSLVPTAVTKNAKLVDGNKASDSKNLDTINSSIGENGKSQTFQDAALAKAKQSIEGQTSGQAKKIDAAGTFFGFYINNQLFRPDYCKANGTDISKFVKIWEEKHMKEYSKTLEIFQAGDVNIKDLINTLERPSVLKLAKDMQAQASQYDVNLNDICQAFVINTDEVVANMHISKVMPLVQATLMLE